MFQRITIENDAPIKTPVSNESALEMITKTEVELARLDLQLDNIYHADERASELLDTLTGVDKLSDLELRLLKGQIDTIGQTVGLGIDTVTLESDTAVEITLEGVKSALLSIIGVIDDLVGDVLSKYKDILDQYSISIPLELTRMAVTLDRLGNSKYKVVSTDVTLTTEQIRKLTYDKTDAYRSTFSKSVNTSPSAIRDGLTYYMDIEEMKPRLVGGKDISIGVENIKKYSLALKYLDGGLSDLDKSEADDFIKEASELYKVLKFEAKKVSLSKSATVTLSNAKSLKTVLETQNDTLGDVATSLARAVKLQAKASGGFGDKLKAEFKSLFSFLPHGYKAGRKGQYLRVRSFSVQVKYLNHELKSLLDYATTLNTVIRKSVVEDK